MLIGNEEKVMNGIMAIKALYSLQKTPNQTLCSSHSLGIMIPFLGINEFSFFWLSQAVHEIYSNA